MLNIPAEYDKDTSLVKFKDISRQLLASLVSLLQPQSSGS
jgi:hypothetical protein